MVPFTRLSFSAIAITLSTLALLSGTAKADCYGRTIGGSDGEGSLCQFAGESQDLMPPQQGSEQGSVTDNLFSQEERIKMLRDVVTEQASQGGSARLDGLVARGTSPRPMYPRYRRPQLWR